MIRPGMRIAIATPAPPRARSGNRVTALRWAGLLRSLGHRVRVLQCWRGEEADLLVAVHARRSYSSIALWRERRGPAPLIVAFAGTDLYADLPSGSREARRALELADRVVVLQPRGLAALPEQARGKALAIVQSARPPPGAERWRPGWPLRVTVSGHLRAVKDPFLVAEAARLLPPSSGIVVEHVGGALDPEHERRAREETASNPRWRWLGALPRRATLLAVARSWLAVIPSRLEGGSNAVSEAVACGVPVIATRIDGTVGLLGDEYPGYVPPGDARALAALLGRAEEEPAIRDGLAAACERVRPLLAPEREREAWRRLLDELVLLSG